MLRKWLKENIVVAALVTVLRVYLGYTWMTAGWKKITGANSFDAGGYLKGALAKASGENPTVQGWWADFLNSFAIPNVKLFNIMIPWGEFLVGVALIVGLFTTFAAIMGMIMNFAFLFSGTISTNPEMLLYGTIILLAGIAASRFGADRWAMPYLANMIRDMFKNNKNKPSDHTKPTLPPMNNPGAANGPASGHA